MKMVSMKMSAAERKEQTEAIDKPEGPRYPYGLSISLNEDSLEKLGLELPEMGEEMMLVATVKVTGVSANDSEYGSSKNVSLQITECCLEPVKDQASTAKKLYDGASAEK